MSDLHPVSIFFLIFAAMLVLYGGAMAKTGNKDLMPLQSVHSVRGKGDVMRVGRITAAIGLIIGVIALALYFFSGQ